MVPSAYLRLLIFLLAVLIPACVVGIGSIPDWGTKIANVAWHGHKINSNKKGTGERDEMVRHHPIGAVLVSNW